MINSFGNQWKIPKSWKIASIKSITSDWKGGAPFKPDDFTDEGFPVLHKGAIHKSGTVLVDSRKKTFTSAEYAQCYQKSVIDRTYMAVTLRDLVPSGPSIGLIANLANSQSEKYVLAQGAYGFHINTDRVHPSYLVWLSNYEPFRVYMKCYAVGSTQIHIRTPVFQELEIPLPPLEEQKRIAAILDKADRVRRKRQEAIRLTEELGRSIFLDMFGDPVTNPKGWKTKVLCDVSEVLTGYAFKSNQYTQDNEDIRLCRGINILPECMNWNDTAYWNKNDIREFERFILREEDIVIAMDRPWISSGFKIAMIQPSDLPSLLVQRVARIRSKSCEWQKYLYSVIQHPAFELHSNPTETTVPHISPRDLQSFPIPVPDEATLQSFNQKIRTVDVIKKKSLSFYQESENLFNSLLQRAFRGEL